MKYALGIEYCGRHYFGWQKQRLPNTIQESVENALSSVADESIALTCAGRTDAGVHALQQVVHFETTAERESHAWVLGSNTLLPDDIAITWAKVIDDEFHARFSALSRTYQYLILNRRARPALFNGLVTWECRALDLARMKAASQALIGQHDFSSYRAVACQARSPERTVHRLDIQRLGEWYVISICANAFLHHMVRNIAGVLMAIGYGKEDIGWAKEILLAKDRTVGGVTAPAAGLYLVDVEYPERFAIPAAPGLLDKFALSA